MRRGRKPYGIVKILCGGTAFIVGSRFASVLPDSPDLQDSEDAIEKLSHDIVVDHDDTSCCSSAVYDTQLVPPFSCDSEFGYLEQDSNWPLEYQYGFQQLPGENLEFGQLPDDQHEFGQLTDDQLEFGQLTGNQLEFEQLYDDQHEFGQLTDDQHEFDRLFDDAASSDLYGFISDQCYQGPFF